MKWKLYFKIVLSLEYKCNSNFIVILIDEVCYLRIKVFICINFKELFCKIIKCNEDVFCI